jgi:hypothetical protein
MICNTQQTKLFKRKKSPWLTFETFCCILTLSSVKNVQDAVDPYDNYTSRLLIRDSSTQLQSCIIFFQSIRNIKKWKTKYFFKFYRSYDSSITIRRQKLKEINARKLIRTQRTSNQDTFAYFSNFIGQTSIQLQTYKFITSPRRSNNICVVFSFC